MWGFSFCLLAVIAIAEKFDGTILSRGDTLGFIGKFAFDYDPNGATAGTIDVTFTVSPSELGNVNTSQLLLFDDEDDSWPSVYGKGLPCYQWPFYTKQSFPPTLDWKFDGKNYVATYSTPLFEKLRPRFWYIVFSNCQPRGNANVDFNLHCLNVLSSSWDEEFGVNEQGLNTLFVLMFIFYIFFGGLVAYMLHVFKQKTHYVHPMLKMFASMILLEFVYVFFCMIHFAKFSNDGYGVSALQTTGQIFNLFVRLIFIVLLLLLASGWSIVSDTLQGKNMILGFMFVFSVIWISGALWEMFGIAPEEVDVPNDIKAMLDVILAVWFLLAFYFLYLIYNSYHATQNELKKTLFMKLGITGFFWFAGLPFITALQEAMSPWVREKSVTISDMLLTTMNFCALAYFLWPSRVELYFTVDKPDSLRPSLQEYSDL